MFRISSLFIVLFFTLVPFSTAQAEAEAGQKAVLVTGASSGLGRAMTEMMASRGYFVYAGARKDRDMQELNAIENVQAVRLDVTKQDEIDAAVTTIRDAGRGLYGLVNNAGVVVLSPLIEIDEEDFDFQMNVNVYGPYRITRAFAPLIMESKGRISIISSISGTLAGSTWGPYSMSKHAMEAFGDPNEVAEAVMHALFNDNPKPRYLVVPNQEQAQWTINRAIERVVEQNYQQKYSYDRGELIEMLDRAMGEQGATAPRPR